MVKIAVSDTAKHIIEMETQYLRILTRLKTIIVKRFKTIPIPTNTGVK